MKITIFIIYSLFIMMFIYHGKKSRELKIDTMGKYPINKKIFIAGKITMFISWFFPLISLFVDFNLFFDIYFLKIVSVLIFLTGFLFFFKTTFNLGGKALKFGIPEDDDSTELKTSGLYSFSRNPMYLAFLIMITGSILFAPAVLNIICALTAIIVHHFIVLSEEKFLEKRFEEEWYNYKKSVNRYF